MEDSCALGKCVSIDCVTDERSGTIICKKCSTVRNRGISLTHLELVKIPDNEKSKSQRISIKNKEEEKTKDYKHISHKYVPDPLKR